LVNWATNNLPFAESKAIDCITVEPYRGLPVNKAVAVLLSENFFVNGSAVNSAADVVVAAAAGGGLEPVAAIGRPAAATSPPLALSRVRREKGLDSGVNVHPQGGIVGGKDSGDVDQCSDGRKVANSLRKRSTILISSASR
jgi:hypothetical protein